MVDLKILTWDAEIRRCIPDKQEPNVSGLEYCEGWKDQANMGISLIGAYLNWLDQYKFYGEENLQELIADFARADVISGFNIFGFDTPLLKATLQRLGLPEKTGMSGKCYDIFYDVKKSLGNNFPKGWTLDNICQETLGLSKDGDGAHAPVLWQRGELGKLVTYLTQDVKMEYALTAFIFDQGNVTNVDPSQGRMVLELEMYKKFLIPPAPAQEAAPEVA